MVHSEQIFRTSQTSSTGSSHSHIEMSSCIPYSQQISNHGQQFSTNNFKCCWVRMSSWFRQSSCRRRTPSELHLVSIFSTQPSGPSFLHPSDRNPLWPRRDDTVRARCSKFLKRSYEFVRPQTPLKLGQPTQSLRQIVTLKIKNLLHSCIELSYTNTWGIDMFLQWWVMV